MWGRVAINLGSIFIPITVLSFVLQVLGRWDQFRLVVLSGLVAAALFHLAGNATDWYIRDVKLYWWGYYGQFGPLGIVFVLHVSVVMGLSFYLLWKRYTSEEGTIRDWRRAVGPC